jgi:hypothetical protein
MKNIFPSFIVLALSATLIGCGTSGSSSGTAGSGTQGGASVDSAILKISENRTRAEEAAAAVKQRFKSSSSQYVKAQRLYREARAKNNSWLDLLQNKIRNGAKPERSPDFNEQSKKAGAATDQFLRYADSVEQPAGVQATPLLAGMGAAEIVKIFVDNGITIWKGYSEQRQAARERNAKDLDRLRWNSWSGTEKTKTDESQENPKPDKTKAKPADKTKPEGKTGE